MCTQIPAFKYLCSYISIYCYIYNIYYKHMHPRTGTYMHINTYVPINYFSYIYIHIKFHSTHMCIHKYSPAYTHMYTYSHVHIHIYVFIYYIHTHMHRYIHVHKCMYAHKIHVYTFIYSLTAQRKRASCTWALWSCENSMVHTVQTQPL